MLLNCLFGQAGRGVDSCAHVISRPLLSQDTNQTPIAVRHCEEVGKWDTGDICEFAFCLTENVCEVKINTANANPPRTRPCQVVEAILTTRKDQVWTRQLAAGAKLSGQGHFFAFFFLLLYFLLSPTLLLWAPFSLFEERSNGVSALQPTISGVAIDPGKGWERPRRWDTQERWGIRHLPDKHTVSTLHLPCLRFLFYLLYWSLRPLC